MKNNFEDWKPPKWHSDYDDPDLDFLLLKAFSTKAAETFPNVKFKLNPFEEGYLCVDIFKADLKIAELHVTNTKIQQLGLFANQHEIHFTDFSEGISFLAEQQNTLPKLLNNV